MRLLALATTFAALLLAQPALAAWKEYTYPDLGFVVEFPAEPTAREGTYKTVLVGKAVQTHIFTLKQEDSLFTATVVDLMDRKEDGANLMGEAEHMMHFLGLTRAISTPRVEPNEAAVYGRQITIDVRDGIEPGAMHDDALKWFKEATGMEIPFGSRLTTNMFFTRGRLYLIQGINLPVPSGDLGSPTAVRFAQSLSFLTVDGKRNRADDPTAVERTKADIAAGIVAAPDTGRRGQ